MILLGEGEAADAKRRLLERAGAVIVGEDAAAALAVVAIEDEVRRWRRSSGSRPRVAGQCGRPPGLVRLHHAAIIDRAPVLIAIGTGGVSAGLAAALRQRLEALLPAGLGRLADQLHHARAALRAHYPDGATRRRALGAALAAGGALDPMREDADVPRWIAGGQAIEQGHVRIALASPDPDALTLRQARWLANADRVVFHPGVPAAILDRARADAVREAWGEAMTAHDGLTVELEMA